MQNYHLLNKYIPEFQLISSFFISLKLGIIACTTPSVNDSTPDMFSVLNPWQFQARDIRVDGVVGHCRSVSVSRLAQCLAISASPLSPISSHHETSNVVI